MQALPGHPAQRMSISHFPFLCNWKLSVSVADPSGPEAVLWSSEAKRLGRKVGKLYGLAFGGLQTLKAIVWFQVFQLTSLHRLIHAFHPAYQEQNILTREELQIQQIWAHVAVSILHLFRWLSNFFRFALLVKQGARERCQFLWGKRGCWQLGLTEPCVLFPVAESSFSWTSWWRRSYILRVSLRTEWNSTSLISIWMNCPRWEGKR